MLKSESLENCLRSYSLGIFQAYIGKGTNRTWYLGIFLNITNAQNIVQELGL